ncbi:hypothetical protein [Methylobacterium fujisawaense]|uniref:hypothetical protein n=1 Tax=Methylobacterium fujisawaense TaxID=107400 RepID=UPI00313B3D25
MTSPANTIARLLASLGLNSAAAVAFRNRLINGDFSVNQRSAPSSPTVYKPGEFIRDRWKAGPTGCTAACAVAPGGDTTIHIGAGSVQQTVEGGLYLREGGTYCLSWQGTANGRITGPGYSKGFSAAPVVASNLTPGSDMVVEFSLPFDGQPVSLRLAQLEPGSTPTVFERRDDETERCRRYYRRLAEPPLRGVIQEGSTAGRCAMPLSPPMRKKPEVTVAGLLFVFDGTAGTHVVDLAADHSTAECLDVDLQLNSSLTVGRPALIFVAGQGGVVDLNAELDQS